jgi:hypothetical protein
MPNPIPVEQAIDGSVLYELRRTRKGAGPAHSMLQRVRREGPWDEVMRHDGDRSPLGWGRIGHPPNWRWTALDRRTPPRADSTRISGSTRREEGLFLWTARAPHSFPTGGSSSVPRCSGILEAVGAAQQGLRERFVRHAERCDRGGLEARGTRHKIRAGASAPKPGTPKPGQRRRSGAAEQHLRKFLTSSTHVRREPRSAGGHAILDGALPRIPLDDATVQRDPRSSAAPAKAAVPRSGGTCPLGSRSSRRSFEGDHDGASIAMMVRSGGRPRRRTTRP